MIKHPMKKSLASALAVILSIPGGVLSAFAADGAPAPVVFQGVAVSDDLVTIKLSTGVLYNSFLTQTPPRLVMELLDTQHDGPSQSAKGKGKFLAGVRTSQFEKSPRLITRVVLDLVKMAGYKVGTTKGGLTVQIVGSVDDQADAPAAVAAPVVAKRAAAAASASAPAPAAQAPVAAAMPKSAETSAIVPPLPAAETKAKARLNITAAQAMKRAGLDGTMSQELAATAQGSDVTKTKIDPAGEGDEEAPQFSRGGRIYSDIMSRLPRDRVTLDFDNTDIRDVLRLLAAKAKVNIVFGADVTGSLTLHLTDVPFNEAFRTALSMMKLTTDQVGGHILRVITPAELKNQRTTSTATTKVYVLNYAKAAEVKATIDAVRGAEGRGGSSTADAKSNTLIVTDSLEGQISTENLISQMDQRPRQVLIETKIVEINANAGLNYGVQWDYASIDVGKSMGKQGTTSVGSTMGVTDPFVNPRQGSGLDRNPVTFGGISPTGGVGAAGRGTGVALAADRVFGALTLGRITNNFILNATLTAAASEGKAKILSEPKIATLNNQAADINITTQIPYVTSNVASTGVQTQTVSYVTTGIQLKVTPSINADGRITLQVNPNVSQPSATAAASSTGAPAVDARTANTTVLVRDGETIVIGGLITDTMQDTISKIPLLGDIPVLGWLFKKKSKTRVRAELLIFVTTRILPD
ncbi:MAG: type IV pilus secretin PilQ [Elusimicrobiota bacterium]|nr:type IV pilus secretin PilQ [Elusimicrobiota bacterium]